MKKAMFRQQYAEKDGIKVISTPVEEVVDSLEELRVDVPLISNIRGEESPKGKKEVKKNGRKHNI